MDTQNSIVKAPPVSDIEAFANYFISQKGLEPEQVSYLVVRERRRELINQLETKELETQAILLNPGTTIVEIEESLLKYRKLYTELVENFRKPFTNFIKQNITEPLMEFEVRINPENNSEYKDLNKKLIRIKTEAAQQAAEAAKKHEEKAKFLAHIKNQLISIQADYKKAVLDEINKMYKFWIENKIENPEIDTLKLAIKEIKLREPIQMQRQFISDEEATKFYLGWLEQQEFFMINEEELLEEALLTVDHKMESYHNDYKVSIAKPEILQDIIKHNQEQVEKLVEDANTMKSVNNLVSTAQPTFNYSPSYKQLKTIYEVNVSNDRDFVLKVLSAYMSNPELDNYFRVKDLMNLRVGQIVKAIGDYATEFPDKKLKEFTYEATKK